MTERAVWNSLAVVSILLMIVLYLFCLTGCEAEQAEVEEIIDEVTETTVDFETISEIEKIGVSINTTSESETATEIETTTVHVSAEELAEIVINQGINGDERRAYLGDRYSEVQNWIDANYEVPYVEEIYYSDSYDYPSGNVLTPDAGVNYYNGVMETYYNMDMSGVVEWMHSLGYEGDYWVRGDGVKMFGDYVMVAADYGWMPKGSIVETSLGTGIICDTGLGGWYWYDIAVAWGD